MSHARTSCLLLLCLFLTAFTCPAAVAGKVSGEGGFSLAFGMAAGAGLFFAGNDNFSGGTDGIKSTAGRTDLAWREYYLSPGLTAAFDQGGLDVYWNLSAIASATEGDGDGAGSSEGGSASVRIDTAAMGVKVADPWGGGIIDSLGLVAGSAPLEIGEGFLVGDGTRDGGKLAAYRLAPQTSFRELAHLAMKGNAFGGDLFYLSTGREDGGTSGIGANVEYQFPRRGTVGALYMKITDSKMETRDGMKVMEFRYKGKPLPELLRNFQLSSHFAWERNTASAKKVDAHALALGGEYSFAWKEITLHLGYSDYSGDENTVPKVQKAFDPLFQSRLGRMRSPWLEGEILGGLFRRNTNKVAITTAFKAKPLENITIGAAFHHLDFDHNNFEGRKVSNRHLADELDLTSDISLGANLALELTLAHSWPGQGIQRLGLDQDADLARIAFFLDF